jgi:hypothetical protein
MPGPLTDLTFPTTADMLAAAWGAWWKKNKIPPSAERLLTYADSAFSDSVFWDWRDDIMEAHAAHLTDRFGDRLLPLCDLVVDLVLAHLDCRGWEFPDPEEEEEHVVISWIAWALTCLRWTLVYEPRDPPQVTYADASAFLNKPPPRPAITPPQPHVKLPPPGQIALL